ncbi:MAG: proline--tRNA ligase, partial [Candidatus Omnitrophica bacterium]|nr:proline--tRNA ligase [Candidatus Omnitrophota bacterium]
MKFSEALIPTLREAPKDAEALSHSLMVKSGMIRRLSSGLYSYLPLGWKSMLKVMDIVRSEMNKQGAQELIMPAIHPEELWIKTGRLAVLGEDMIKFKNRAGKNMVLGPTHEEVITSLIAQEVQSHKQLPIIAYQIQAKFRDELRPRFGVIRTCEFIMKDAYSFNSSWESLDESYQKMYRAYCNIFQRCSIEYLVVEADPGIMGGDISHEFMAPSEYGEDKVVNCPNCGRSLSCDLAGRREPEYRNFAKTTKELKEIHTPGISSVEAVSKALKIGADRLLKTIIYKSDNNFIAAIVRGDSDINEAKLRRYLKSADLRMATTDEIKKATGSEVGFSGPVGLNIKIFADFEVRGTIDCVTGANKTDYHLINVAEGRDFKADVFIDLRYLKDGDLCLSCGKEVRIQNTIEIGHIFKLGTRYSKPLEAVFTDEKGQKQDIIMGCYGIGINRIIATFIEQHNDEKGIVWSPALAPYLVAVIATNIDDEKIRDKSNQIYRFLQDKDIGVILDDRPIRAGSKFNDLDLIGIPYQVIVGSNFLQDGRIELKSRDRKKAVLLTEDSEILQHLDI